MGAMTPLGTGWGHGGHDPTRNGLGSWGHDPTRNGLGSWVHDPTSNGSGIMDYTKVHRSDGMDSYGPDTYFCHYQDEIPLCKRILMLKLVFSPNYSRFRVGRVDVGSLGSLGSWVKKNITCTPGAAMIDKSRRKRGGLGFR